LITAFGFGIFTKSWKGTKIITLPKPSKESKFPQNLHLTSLFPTTGKIIQKVIKRHIEMRDLHNASQFGFHARHSTALQCMRLTDHLTLNLNNNMFMAAVFLDFGKAFDRTWHPGLLL
jgi:hypothetical protein